MGDKNWYDGRYVRAENGRCIDAAIHDIWAHPCPSSDIEAFGDKNRLVLGWRCKCGAAWEMRLIDVQKGGRASRYSEEIRTEQGRQRLVSVFREAIVPRCEERLNPVTARLITKKDWLWAVGEYMRVYSVDDYREARRQLLRRRCPRGVAGVFDEGQV